MAQLILGQGGRGTALAYTAPPDMILRVESVSFTVDVGVEAGPHYALVGLGDTIQPVVTTAVSPDGASPGTAVTYSFGVGYVSAAIKNATPNLKQATAALPEIELFPGGKVRIAMNQESGTIAPTDTIANVFIYADLIRVDDGPSFGVPEPIVLIGGPGAS